MKIIKYNDTKRKLEQFQVEEFSSVDRSNDNFTMETFGADEHSVQDEYIENSMKNAPRIDDTPSYRYTPKANSMFSAYEDDLDMNALADGNFETVLRPRLFSAYEDEDSEAGRKSMFSTYEPDEEEAAMSAKIAEQAAHETASMGASKEQTDRHTEGDAFQETPLGEEALSGEDVNVPKSQQDIVKENARLAELEQEVEQLKQSLTDKDTEISELNTRIQQSETDLPAKLSAAREEGKNAQLAEGERKYEAQKQDYIKTVQKSWDDALVELKKIDETIKTLDEQIPDIVVGYMKELVGVERKLNDGLVVNIIKSALSRLTDLQQVIFTVNPEDADVITQAYPQYGVSIDQTIPKGSVKVQTKVGEVDLSIDAWMDSLEKQINEQLKPS